MANETIGVEFKEDQGIGSKLWPLALTVLLCALDQITKLLVVKFIPLNTIGVQFFGDFFRLIHVQNPGVAFSMGHSLSANVRSILFAFIPLIVIIMVFVIYFRNSTFTHLQRWAICGIIGGGLGNLIDRFFRKGGVVDFIDVKFFGIFGLDRWPTFNVADMSVVICGIILVISFLVTVKNDSAKEKAEKDKK